MDRNPPQTLSQILAGMFDQAAKAPGFPVRKKLGSGLEIDLLILKDGITKFQISRARPGPSSTEWSTVLKNLPYPVTAQPLTLKWGNHIYFKAAWPTPEAKPTQAQEEEQK